MSLTARQLTKLQRSAASLLGEGESIEDGIIGHTGKRGGAPNLIGGFIESLIREATAEGRIALRTNRRVLYLHTYLYRPTKIERLLGEWPVGAAPITIVQLSQRGGGGTILEVADVERIETALGPDGTVTPIAKVGAEQMHVYQRTLEEPNLVKDFVDIAARAGPFTQPR